MASLYLSGRAKMWYQSWRKGRRVIDWEVFEQALNTQFGNSLMKGRVEQSNSLQQEDLVIEEQELKLENSIETIEDEDEVENVVETLKKWL